MPAQKPIHEALAACIERNQNNECPATLRDNMMFVSGYLQAVDPTTAELLNDLLDVSG